MSRTMEAMMEKQGHTPGPWTFEPQETNIECPTPNVGCVAGDGWSLALIFADGGIGQDAAEANARLIAAAPDLLAALKLARAYMDVCLGAPEWDGKNPYPVIDAAIAKATGERT